MEPVSLRQLSAEQVSWSSVRLASLTAKDSFMLDRVQSPLTALYASEDPFHLGDDCREEKEEEEEETKEEEN